MTPIFITIKNRAGQFYASKNAKTGAAIFVSDVGCALPFSSMTRAVEKYDELTAAGYRDLTLSQERGEVTRRETA